MSDDDKTIIAPISQVKIESSAKKAFPSLVQYNGGAVGRRYMLDMDTVVIGRSLDSDIAVSESSVSRHHARLNIRGKSISIEDLGSANGTFINDEKVVGQVPMKDQDMLRLGTIIFKLFTSDSIDSMVQDKIYRMATVDALTQLFNRNYVLEALENEFKICKNTKRALSLIYYDLDHFKSVNDKFGHNSGDQVLREIASVVKNVIRKDDVLGRFGGEEFIIILPRTDLKTAAELAERVRKACEEHVIQLEIEGPGGKKPLAYKQTISVGVAQFQDNMAGTKDFLETADKGLYSSKQGGRNRVTVT